MEIRKAFFTPNPEIHAHQFGDERRKRTRTNNNYCYHRRRQRRTLLAPFGFVVCFRRNGNRCCSVHTHTPTRTRHRMDERERVGNSCFCVQLNIIKCFPLNVRFIAHLRHFWDLIPHDMVPIGNYYEKKYYYLLLFAILLSFDMHRRTRDIFPWKCLLGKAHNFRRKNILMTVRYWLLIMTWRIEGRASISISLRHWTSCFRSFMLRVW